MSVMLQPVHTGLYVRYLNNNNKRELRNDKQNVSLVAVPVCDSRH